MSIHPQYNTVWLPVVGDRKRNTPDGPVTESYDQLMWPAVDAVTDSLIDLKIRYAVEAERERCAKIADGARLAGGIQPNELPQLVGYHTCAQSIADTIRGKDRGCDPPQAKS